jgi:hypothetical protein
MTAKELSNLTDESIALIQKYMKEQNVTNHHLAKEAGVQATQLWLFLNKQRGLTNSSLEKIGKVIAQDKEASYFTNKAKSSNELILECRNSIVIPWSDYPSWCNWVAMDADGEWYYYDVKPEKTAAGWANGDFVNDLNPDYYPKNFTGDWTESLFERPQHQK